MPALPVIPDTVRVALRWTSASLQTAVNVIHIRGVGGAISYAQLEAALNAHVTANMWATVSTNAQISQVDMTQLDGVTASQSFAPTTPAHWTGGAGTDFSPQVATLVKFQTALRGRAHRGRIFLPYGPESIITAGGVDSTFMGDAEAAWAAFQIALLANAPAMEHVVASYKLASAQQVTNYAGELEAGTQRRRQQRNRGG